MPSHPGDCSSRECTEALTPDPCHSCHITCGSATQRVGILQSRSAKMVPSRCCQVPWKGPAPDQFGHALQSDQTRAWAPGRLVGIAQTVPVQLWPPPGNFSWHLMHNKQKVKQMENPSPEIFLKAGTLAHYSFYIKASRGLQ